MPSPAEIFTPKQLSSYARSYAPGAIRGLATIASSRKAPHAARVAAYRELLDRGYGKAMQPIAEELNITVRHVVTGVDRPGDDALVVDADPVLTQPEAALQAIDKPEQSDEST